MQKKYLMTPGPTPVPAEGHARPWPRRSSTTARRTSRRRSRAAIDNLKYVFQTEGDVLLFACSGTGVMESAIVNCFSAGDTVIVCRNGKFGDRQKQICETYGLNVVDLAVRVDRGREARPTSRQPLAEPTPRRAASSSRSPRPRPACSTT